MQQTNNLGRQTTGRPPAPPDGTGKTSMCGGRVCQKGSQGGLLAWWEKGRVGNTQAVVQDTRKNHVIWDGRQVDDDLQGSHALPTTCSGRLHDFTPPQLQAGGSALLAELRLPLVPSPQTAINTFSYPSPAAVRMAALEMKADELEHMQEQNRV